MKRYAIALLLLSTVAASAQTLPPDQTQLNAQTQQQLNNQNQQTQMNNLQTQQSNLQNQERQQQLFNSTQPAAPAVQRSYTPPPSSTP